MSAAAPLRAGRPAGAIRLALREAVSDLHRGRAERGESLLGATYREIAQAACVGFDAARATLNNMVRAGELDVVGTEPPGCGQCGRPPARYAPRPALNAFCEPNPLDPLRREGLAVAC